jgi:hypothetical protein
MWFIKKLPEWLWKGGQSLLIPLFLYVKPSRCHTPTVHVIPEGVVVVL